MSGFDSRRFTPRGCAPPGSGGPVINRRASPMIETTISSHDDDLDPETALLLARQVITGDHVPVDVSVSITFDTRTMSDGPEPGTLIDRAESGIDQAVPDPEDT